MVPKMGGDRRDWEYPGFTSEEAITVSNRDEAEITNLSEEENSESAFSIQ